MFTFPLVYSTVDLEKALMTGEKTGVVYFQVTDKVSEWVCLCEYRYAIHTQTHCMYVSVVGARWW